MTDIYQVSNYTPCQIGLVKGEDGRDGIDGINGVDGKSGKDGKDGLRGLSGSDGKSNYQLALDSGFIGSLDDYLASIRGADGADGADGEKGEKGDVLFATPFATKALMTASTLVDGDYAMVTDDTVNNGLYVKTAGAWVKSTYDPLAQAKTYTDAQKADTLSRVFVVFNTFSGMIASGLPANTYARVINDTNPTRNGDYQKIGPTWTKTLNDPIAYTDALKTDILSRVFVVFNAFGDMTASGLPANTYARVVNDTVVSRNGDYQKIGATWTKVGYDPTALANTYTDNKVKGVTNNFKTKALMTASTLPNDSYAMVTEDTEANNGWYSKVAGAWVKSTYDPVAYTAAFKTDILSRVFVVFDTLAIMGASVQYPSGTYGRVINDSIASRNGDYQKIGATWTKVGYDPTALANTYTDSQKSDTLSKVVNAFSTVALMSASTLPDGASAKVINDTQQANNGDYHKVSGVWVKSVYDYSANAVNLVTGGIDLRGDGETHQYPNIATGKWAALTTYPFGRIVPVTPATEYEVVSGSDIAAVYIMKEKYVYLETELGSNTVLDPSRLLLLGKNEKKTIYVPANCAYMYIVDKQTVGASTYRTPQSITPLTDTRQKSENIKLNHVTGKIENISNSLKGVVGEFKEFAVYNDATNITSRSFKISPRTALTDANSPSEKTVRISLVAGDVLSFDYRQIFGVILWESINADGSEGYPILAGTEPNKHLIKNHVYTARKSVTLDVCGAVLSSIKVNDIKSTTFQDLGYIQYTSGVIYNYDKPSNHIDYRSFTLKKGETLRIENVGADYLALATKRPTESGGYRSAISFPADYTETNFEWTVDSDVEILANLPKTATLKIKRLKTVADIVTELKVLIAASGGSGGGSGEVLPPLPPLPVNEFRNPMIMPEKEFVFATHQNFILKTETLEGTEYIALSTDLGKSWKYLENIIGDIVAYHFFSDNTIMLCSPSAVWTLEAPYTVINKSIVYDHDGSAFTPYNHHFFNQQHGNRTMFVDGKEMYVWGEYSIGNPNVRMWYTTDFGKTVKCAVNFGVTVMDGAVRPIRHVHDIAQDPYTGDFYLTTGDSVPQNFFFKATYNVSEDTFSWELLGTGAVYKLGKMWFDKTYIYYITDYTEEQGLQAQNGIYRLAKAHAKDITKASAIYICEPDLWGIIAPFRLMMDRNGNKVLMSDHLGRQRLWIATEGMDFRLAMLDKPILLYYVIGANYNGDVYAAGYNDSGEVSTNSFLKLTGGTYNVTKMLRNNGVPNFMTGNILVNNYNNIVGF